MMNILYKLASFIPVGGCVASNTATPVNRGIAPATPQDSPQADVAPAMMGCANRCGSQAPSGCWCDARCGTYGDCCEDSVAACGQRPSTCEELCQGQDPDICDCSCEALCEVPADTCDGDTSIRHAATGCDPSATECEIETTQEDCELGCEDGACLRPPGTPPAGNPNDPFDAANCSGEPIAPNELDDLLELGSFELGDYRIEQRTADCEPGGDCDEWSRESAFVLTQWAGTEADVLRELVGAARLRADGESAVLVLESPYGHEGEQFGATCTVEDGSVECSAFTYLALQEGAGWDGYVNYDEELEIGDPARAARFEGTLQPSCLRLRARATSDTLDQEVALIVRW